VAATTIVNFIFLGTNGYWWSASEFVSAGAWGRYLYGDYAGVPRNYHDERLGLCVRCVKA